MMDDEQKIDFSTTDHAMYLELIMEEQSLDGIDYSETPMENDFGHRLEPVE